MVRGGVTCGILRTRFPVFSSSVVRSQVHVGNPFEMRFHPDGSSDHELAHLCPEVLCSQYPRREGDGAARCGIRARPVRWADMILAGVDPVAVLGLS